MVLLDRMLVPPAVASQLAGHVFLTRRNRCSQQPAQVKIAANTLAIGALNAEQGTGMLQVQHVFDLADPRPAVRPVEFQLRFQRLEPGKLRGQRRGVLHAPSLTLAKDRARARGPRHLELLMRHVGVVGFRVAPDAADPAGGQS